MLRPTAHGSAFTATSETRACLAGGWEPGATGVPSRLTPEAPVPPWPTAGSLPVVDARRLTPPVVPAGVPDLLPALSAGDPAPAGAAAALAGLAGW